MPWSWDPTLYAGSAPHYAVGRVPYPAGVASALVSALSLDGTQRLLDVGCGPGSLTLLLAPHVGEAVGVDADGDMLAEAARLADSLPNVRWVRLRAEELPGDLPPVDVVTFAQSFHWMDRPRVAAVVRRMLRPGGAVVHVGATTHEGIDPEADLPFPRPPREEVAALVRRYLGPVRRAGQGVLPSGTSGGEDDVFRAAGFTGPSRIEVPGRGSSRGRSRRSRRPSTRCRAPRRTCSGSGWRRSTASCVRCCPRRARTASSASRCARSP